MKSVVCNLDGGAGAAAAAMTEAERFALYCNLSEKDGLHLRLLAEELIGMATGLLDLRSGTFWIEQEGPLYRLFLSAQAPVGENARARLLAASSTGEDTYYRGVSGKIRQALDFLIGGVVADDVPAMVTAPSGLVTSQAVLEWSLQQYRQNVAREEKAMAYDELEKSVLGRLADDIHVGARANHVEIIIDKTL